MRLNMIILAHYLQESVMAASIRSEPTDTTLSHAELYDESLKLLSDVVYIVEDSEKIPSPSTRGVTLRLVLLGDAPPDISERQDIEYLQLRPEKPAKILDVIQRIFRKYSHWEETLQNLLMNKCLVNDLLDASMGVFQSNILVHDRDLNTIAYKIHSTSADDSPLTALSIDEPLSPIVAETFSHTVKANSPKEDPFSIQGPHFWISANGPLCLNMNIFHDGAFIARVVLTTLDKTAEPTTRDVVPFLTLCTYIESTMSLHYANLLEESEDAFARMIHNLFLQKSVNEQELHGITSSLGWDHWNDEYLLLAIEMSAFSSRQLSSSYPLLSILARSTEMLKSLKTIVFDNRGYLLVNMTKCNLDKDSVRQLLARIAKETGCYFCAGRSIKGLRHLHQAFEESGVVLELSSAARSINNAPPILDLDFVSSEIITSSISKMVSPLSFCPAELMEVIHYDNKHHSEIYKTIRTYIESNCSPSKSAKELFVQRSTFLYRLRKGQELLKMDLEDPDVQLRLRLCFKLLDTLTERKFRTI